MTATTKGAGVVWGTATVRSRPSLPTAGPIRAVSELRCSGGGMSAPLSPKMDRERNAIASKSDRRSGQRVEGSSRFLTSTAATAAARDRLRECMAATTRFNYRTRGHSMVSDRTGDKTSPTRKKSGGKRSKGRDPARRRSPERRNESTTWLARIRAWRPSWSILVATILLVYSAARATAGDIEHLSELFGVAAGAADVIRRTLDALAGTLGCPAVLERRPLPSRVCPEPRSRRRG